MWVVAQRRIRSLGVVCCRGFDSGNSVCNFVLSFHLFFVLGFTDLNSLSFLHYLSAILQPISPFLKYSTEHFIPFRRSLPVDLLPAVSPFYLHNPVQAISYQLHLDCSVFPWHHSSFAVLYVLISWYSALNQTPFMRSGCNSSPFDWTNIRILIFSFVTLSSGFVELACAGASLYSSVLYALFVIYF